MKAALLRYRITAWVVGVGLLVLVFVAVPLKHFAHRPAAVAVVGPFHGLLFMVYLVFTLDLAVRNRWAPWRTLLVMIAGTVPFLSFVAERKVTSWVTASQVAGADR